MSASEYPAIRDLFECVEGSPILKSRHETVRRVWLEWRAFQMVLP
jgi:hypothetical protein